MIIFSVNVAYKGNTRGIKNIYSFVVIFILYLKKKY